MTSHISYHRLISKRIFGLNPDFPPNFQYSWKLCALKMFYSSIKPLLWVQTLKVIV